MWYYSYVVNIERWSPSNSIGSPSNSTVYIHVPTMSSTPTDLEDNGMKHNSTCTQYVNIHMMISDSVLVGLPYRVLIPSVVATAIIFVFVLIVIMVLCKTT